MYLVKIQKLIIIIINDIDNDKTNRITHRNAGKIKTKSNVCVNKINVATRAKVAAQHRESPSKLRTEFHIDRLMLKNFSKRFNYIQSDEQDLFPIR